LLFGRARNQKLGFSGCHRAATTITRKLPSWPITIVNVLRNGSQIAHELSEAHCLRGAEIARKMRFPEAVAQGIQSLDEYWDGGGMPARLRGTSIPIYSRIALMAQVIDVFHTGNGVEAARREVRRRSGTWFDPQLAEAFERIAERREFWATLRSNNLREAIHALEPEQRGKTPATGLILSPSR
jgi:hypothetical protein